MEDENVRIQQKTIIIHYCCLCDCVSFRLIYLVAKEQM